MNAPLKITAAEVQPLGAAVERFLAASELSDAAWHRLDPEEQNAADVEMIEAKHTLLAQFSAHGVSADAIRKLGGLVL